MLTLCHNYYQVSPNTKNNKDVVQHYSKKKFVFGLFILLLVAVLWVVSSELTKYLYNEKKLERPFLITYVRSSLLLVYLIVLCFSPPTRDPCRPADYTQLLEPTAETDDENYYHESTSSLPMKPSIPLLNIGKPMYCLVREIFAIIAILLLHYLTKINIILSEGDSTFVPVRAGETTDSDDAAPRAVRFNKVAEVRVMSAAMAGEALLARLSWAASVRASEHAQRRAAAAATKRHIRLALLFSVPWFISNYLYRLSLLHTSSSSAIVYTSTTSAFALSFGAIFAQVPTDRFTISKCVAVLLTAAGLVVLGLSESHQTNWTAVLSALGSSFFYALHLLLFRQELRKGEGINSILLIGVVGCACGCMAWAMGGVLAATGIEKAELPPTKLWSWLLLDAILGPLLLDSLWIWGRSLTSSKTATSMLALSIPLGACVEFWRGTYSAGAWRVLAALFSSAGWATAAIELPRVSAPLDWLTTRMRAAEGFSTIRNIAELDEESEALMSSDEPT